MFECLACIMHVYAPRVCSVRAQMCQSSGTGVKDGGEAPGGCWK